MTASWLMGVFVFAILIGDIRDIVGNARRNEIIFQKEMDAIGAYMNKNKVNRHVQNRIRRWMDYTWTQQKSFDESQVAIDQIFAISHKNQINLNFPIFQAHLFMLSI